MRTVVIKDYRDFGNIKSHSQENDGIFRKYDGTKVVEVMHIGEYGVIQKIFTTERTLKETGVSYKAL